MIDATVWKVVGRARQLSLLAGGSLLVLCALGEPIKAQDSGVRLSPVEVRTARPRPAQQARRPVVRSRAVRVQRPTRRVARVAPPPISSAEPAAPFPSPGTGLATGERPDGPVQGFVATNSATATKSAAPIIETPQAISVIGREQIDTLKPQSLVEATRYSPGIRSETFGADPRNDWFLIRGFDAQTTGYYLNSLQLFSTAFATFRLEPFGLERIEILRGPSSVLYGGTNPGGLVNAISKKPTFEPLRYVEFGINSFGNAYGAFDIGGPGGIDGTSREFAYRLTGLMKGGDTQTDFTGDDRLFFAPSFTYKPTDATSFTFLSSFQRDSTNGQNFLPYQGTVAPAPFGRIPTNLFTSEPFLDRFTREQTMVGYELKHSFSDTLTFRQNVRLAHLEIDFRSVYGVGYAAPPTPTSAELFRFNFITQPRANLVTADNQLEWLFDTGPLHHTLLGGIDYKRYNIIDSQGFAFGPNLNLLAPVYQSAIFPPASRYIRANITQEQLGVYLQDQIKWDRFTLLLSGRHDWVTTDTANYLTPSASGNGDDSAFSGRAGLIYNFDNGLAPYVAYSKSFVPLVGFISGTTNALAPETGEQIEAGIKYQLPGTKTFIGANVFDLTRQNVVTTDPNNALQQLQIGEVRSRGYEVEAGADLADGLKLVAAFTAYDLETTRTLDPVARGKAPPAIPERFGSVLIDYTFPDGPLRGFGFGWGVRYVGHSYADIANAYQVPAYVLNDAVVHYERNGWRAALSVTNVLDDVYVGSCSSLNACFYGERRKALFSLSYRW